MSTTTPPEVFDIESIHIGTQLDYEDEIEIWYFDRHDGKTVEYISRKMALELISHLADTFNISLSDLISKGRSS